MTFVDGTNFLIEFARFFSLKFRADKPPEKVLRKSVEILANTVSEMSRLRGVRYYWFASYQGGEEDSKTYRHILRELQFEPVLFKKN
jgi:hypothetical protein